MGLCHNSSTPDFHLETDNQCTLAISECKYIQRLIVALKHHQSFKMDGNIHEHKVFTNFMNKAYKHPILIQDFYHLMKNHDDEIYDIKKYIENGNNDFICDIKTCSASDRHYRLNNNDQRMNIDPHLSAYCDTIDSLHVYLLHSHQIGMRIVDEKIDEDGFNGDNSKKHENKNYDPEFARYKNILSLTTESTQRFERITSGNNKYKINQVESDDIIDDNENGDTFLDSVIDNLYQENVSEDDILKLINYLKSEKYETETVDLDLFLSENGGNINEYMVHNIKCMQCVVNMFKETRSYAFHVPL